MSTYSCSSFYGISVVKWELRTQSSFCCAPNSCPDHCVRGAKKILWKWQKHSEHLRIKTDFIFFYRHFLRRLLVYRRKEMMSWKGLQPHNWKLTTSPVTLTWHHERQGGVHGSFPGRPMPALLCRGSHKWGQEINRELNLRRKAQESSSNPEVIKEQQKRSVMPGVCFRSCRPGFHFWIIF